MPPKLNDLDVPCPFCGTVRSVSRIVWTSTFREDQKWNGRTRKYEASPGPDEPIECYTCHDFYPAHQWHRALERQEIAKRGWKTPAMEKSL
jgi:hypothetical protein